MASTNLLVFFLFSYLFLLESTMAACPSKVEFKDFRICVDGSIERKTFTLKSLPPSLDLVHNVDSKDVVYSSEINKSVRIFLPLEAKNKGEKLPLLVYYHGGGFCVGNTTNPPIHNMSNLFAAEAKAVVVSVNFRLAPENKLPLQFEDSWTALQWIVSHVNGNGPEEWLNLYADFDKLFLMGDSAGGSIAHNVALRQGSTKRLENVNLRGIILQMPWILFDSDIAPVPHDTFHNTTGDLYNLIYPAANGVINGLLNPADDPSLASLGCAHVLVVVGELDDLKKKQYYYFDKLVNSGWKGKADIIEIKGAGHMSNFNDSNSALSVAMRKQMVDFLVSWYQR